MGDRVSIQFMNGADGDDKSVVLFSHWGGMDEVAIAKQFAKDLKTRAGTSHTYPLDRLEPETVMVDYIVCEVSKHREGGHIVSSFYLKATPEEGDNSDNGHWIIDLQTGEAISPSGARL